VAQRLTLGQRDAQARLAASKQQQQQQQRRRVRNYNIRDDQGN
jgi:hypothetical protein